MARETQILSQVRVKVPDLALKQNKEVSLGNTAPKGEVTPALETKVTPLVPSVSSELKPLQAPHQSHPMSEAIAQHAARKVDQSLEQQLYSSVWGGVAAAIIKTPTVNTTAESRRAIDELQQLLVASDAREKKRKGSNIWDSSFFRSIATIIGPEAAETVTKKIEHFSKQTNNSPAAVNQLVKDIAAALTTGDSIQRLHIATQVVENAIASEIKARLDNKSGDVLPLERAVPQNTDQNSAIIEKIDIRHPLNHPVPEIRDALIQMAQPGVNPARGMITLPEIEPIARQLMPAATNLGFQGTREEFTEALYMLAQRVEDGRGVGAGQIHAKTEQHLTEKHGSPNPQLVSIVTDLLARIQYAKAASLNEGEVAHAILADGAKPATVNGQVLADHAAGILEATGGFTLASTPAAAVTAKTATVSLVGLGKGSSTGEPLVGGETELKGPKKIVAGADTPENLQHDPAIKLLEKSEAKKYTLQNVADLTKRIKELANKSALAHAKGDLNAVRSLEFEAKDTLADNKNLVTKRSHEEQVVINSLFSSAKAAEDNRLEQAKKNIDSEINLLAKKIADEAGSQVANKNISRDEILKRFGVERTALVKKLDPSGDIAFRDAEVTEARQGFEKQLDRTTQKTEDANRAAADLKKKRDESVADFHTRADKGDLLGAVQFNPEAGLDILKGPQGAQMLAAHLSKLKTSDERVGFLTTLKTGLGAEAVSQVIENYDTLLKTSLVYEIVSAGTTPKLRKEVAARICSQDNGLFTKTQRDRAAFMVESHYALTVASIKKELENIPQKLLDLAKEKRKARKSLDDDLNTKFAEEADLGKALESAIGEVASRYRLSPETNFDQLTDFLRIRAGDPKIPPSNESKSAAVVLGHLQKLKTIKEREEQLKHAQKHGDNNEITKLTTEMDSNFGGLLQDARVKLSAESNAVSKATVYLTGLKSKIENEKDASKKSALIAELDRADWIATSARVQLELSADKPNAGRAQSLLVFFISGDSEAPKRTPEAARAAQNVLDAIKAVCDYEKVATEVSYKRRPNITKKPETAVTETEKTVAFYSPISCLNTPQEKKVLDLTKAFEDSRYIKEQWSELPFVIEPNQRKVKDALDVTSKNFLQTIASVSTLEGAKLLDPEKQLALGAGGTDVDHYHLVDRWENVERMVQVAKGSLSQPISSQRVEFFDPKKQITTELLVLNKIVEAEPRDLSSYGIARLRQAAESDPEFKKLLAAVNSQPHDSQNESREILVRLTDKEQDRVRAFVSLSNTSKLAPVDLWKEVKAYKPESLGGIAKASESREKLKAIEDNLSSLSLEKRAEVLSDYKKQMGCSIGATLLAKRPVGPNGREVLVALSGSPLVTNDDLKTFFPKDATLPATLVERQSAISRALGQDVQEMRLDLSPLTQQFYKSAQEHGRWTAAHQLAVKNGLQAEAVKAQTELTRIDAENRRLQNEALKSVRPETAARLGLHEHLDAIRNSAQNTEAASIVAPNSKYFKVCRKVAEHLQNSKPNTALAGDLLAKENLSSDEMVLVRALYAEIASQLKPLKDQRRLTGDLAQDLNDSGDPSNPETKRAQLLAVGGPDALREASLILITEGIRLKSDGMTLRGLVVAKSYGALDYVMKGVADNSLTKKANEYLNAASNKTTNVLTALEIEVQIYTGEIPNLPGYDKAVNLMKSAETFQQGVVEFGKASIKDSELVGRAMDMVDSLESFNKLLNALNEEAHGLNNSFMYRNGKEPAFIQYVQQQGSLGMFDAAVFEKRITAATNGKKLSPEQLAKCKELREDIKEQLSALNNFVTIRQTIHQEAINLELTVKNTRAESQRKLDQQFLYDSGHKENIILHNGMINNQQHLLGKQADGFRDIKHTQQAMTVMFIVIMEDVVNRTDRGLTTEDTAQQFSALRERDQKVEWVVTRKHVFDQWVQQVQKQNENIEWHDFYGDLVHTISKTVVVIGISLIPVPGAPLIALGVATAWNATDKVVRYNYGSIDGATAFRQFGIELVMDGSFYALNVLKFGHVVASVNGAVPGKIVEVGRRIWKFDWLGKLRDPISLGKNALQQTVHNAGERMVGATLKQEGGMVAEKVLKDVAEAVYGEASKQMAAAAAKGVSKIGQISEWFELSIVKSWSRPPVYYTPTFDNKNNNKELPKSKEIILTEEKGKNTTPPPSNPVEKPKNVANENDFQKDPQKAKDVEQKLQGLKEKVLDNPALLAVVEALIAKWQALPQDLKEKISNNPTLLATIEGLIAKLQNSNITPERRAELEGQLKALFPQDIQILWAYIISIIYPNPAPVPPPVPPQEAEQGTIYGNYGGLFNNFTFGDSLNTGSIWTKNTTQNVLPTLPPSPPKPPTPPVFTILPPKKPDSGGGTTGPIAVSDEKGSNSYILAAKREEKIEAEKIVAEERLREVLSAQVLIISQQNTQAIATQNATAQQLALATSASQADQQIGLQVALVDGTIIAQSMASTTILASPIQQSQSQSQEQSQEPLRLREGEAATYTYALTAATSVLSAETVATTTTLSTIDTVPQQIIGTRLQPTVTLKELAQDEEILVRTNLVAKKDAQIKDAQLDNISKEETSTAASAEQDKSASVSKQASALNIRVEQAAEVETVQVLSLNEQQTVIAEQLLTEQIISESIHRAQEQQLLSQIEKVQAAAALVTAQSLVTAPFRGSLATPLMAEATPFLEATPDYEPLFPSNESDPAPVRKVQRKVKSLKEQDRLRNIVMQQLLTLNFNQSRKSDLLKLLITLGISEKEYRELVAKVGEAEARSMAAKAEGREKVARRIEAPQANTKEPVRLKGEVKPATAKISRAELYVRMKQ